MTEAEMITGLSNEIAEWAKTKGFHEDWEMADELEHLAYTVAMRDGPVWEEELCKKAAKALRTNIVGTSIALIHSEASEMLEELRNKGLDGIMAEIADGHSDFIEEAADVEIRTKHLAARLGADLGSAEMAKIEKNRGRPYKHGKKF